MTVFRMHLDGQQYLIDRTSNFEDVNEYGSAISFNIPSKKALIYEHWW